MTFNRQRIMLLQASISKSSGLRPLLDALGVSLHNALGIGDAENDHELLCSCEYAVEWGSKRLRELADEVLSRTGPAAVAAFIDKVSQQIRLPLDYRDHYKVTPEAVEDQPPVEMVIRRRNVLIAGDTQSGKSWITGLLMEQMIFQGYTVYVFDPGGDYQSLGSLPNTVVLDLSHLSHLEKFEYIRQHLPLVAKYRRK